MAVRFDPQGDPYGVEQILKFNFVLFQRVGIKEIVWGLADIGATSMDVRVIFDDLFDKFDFIGAGFNLLIEFRIQ